MTPLISRREALRLGELEDRAEIEGSVPPRLDGAPNRRPDPAVP